MTHTNKETEGTGQATNKYNIVNVCSQAWCRH